MAKQVGTLNKPKTIEVSIVELAKIQEVFKPEHVIKVKVDLKWYESMKNVIESLSV